MVLLWPCCLTSRPADSALTYTDELFSILEPWLDNADTSSWDDVDRDGITNDLDEFPRSAAAEDFDGDGLPDSFLEGCDETCIADAGLVLDADSDNDGTPTSADPGVYNPQVRFLPASARRAYDGGGAAAPLSVLLIPLLTVAGRRKTVSMANDNELP